jgi:imidazolonepropionase-like amidohydrolase
MTACALALAVLAVALVGCAPTPESGSGPSVVAIINGRLFDATDTTAIDDGAVVFEGNRITAAGPASAVDVPDGAHVIDAGGGLIMPGVIDNHMHAFWPDSAMLTSDEDTLTPWLQAGVTTLVDTGTIRHTLRAHRALAESVTHPPRFFMAGPLITVPGGYPTTRRENDMAMYAWTVEGPEEAYEVAAKLIDEEGADLIKIAVETGFDTDYEFTEGWPTLSRDEIEAVVRAAHERGRTVRAHVTNPLELLVSAQAGVDAAAHTPIHEIPDEVLDEVVTYDMILISTANIWGYPRRERGRPVGPNLYRYHQRGGIVVLGTDVPYQRGSIMPVGEMLLFIEAGFTPAEVLIASTRNGALAMNLDDVLGTLEVGKLADIIVVEGDPLTDIEAMANVSVVIRDGEIIPLSETAAER